LTAKPRRCLVTGCDAGTDGEHTGLKCRPPSEGHGWAYGSQALANPLPSTAQYIVSSA
jgi:hypothetical protein